MAKDKPPVKPGGFRFRTTMAERRQSSFLSHRCTFFFLHGRSSLERCKPSDVLLINWSHTGFVRCHKTTSLAGHLDDLLSGHDNPLCSQDITRFSAEKTGGRKLPPYPPPLAWEGRVGERRRRGARARPKRRPVGPGRSSREVGSPQWHRPADRTAACPGERLS